jgi:hypothetical protein
VGSLHSSLKQEQAGYTKGGLGLRCDGQPWKPARGGIACGGTECGSQSMPHSGHYGHTSQQLS